MKVPVFRSLDRTNKFLGIRGSYLIYAVAGVAVCFFIGMTLGFVIFKTGAIGLILSLILSGFVYMYLISFQAKHNEKERDQIASLKRPDVIKVKPIPICRMFKTKFVIK